MGFSKTVTAEPASSTTVSTPPPTVTETQESETQADYSQRSANRKGLLSTLLSNRNRTSGVSVSFTGGNQTLG